MEETQRASEPDSDTEWMLELSDQEFKIAIINMLRALISRQHARTDGQCKQRDGNSKKEPKRNARDQKHYNKK